MDELERLANAYRTQPSSSASSRFAVLLNIERLGDSRALRFLLEVLGDPTESTEVRVHLLKRLRNSTSSELRARADDGSLSKTIGEVLAASNSQEELRVQAALGLGDLTETVGVLAMLSAVSLARDESIDLRYAAFTSLERAGPTPESIAAMRQIANDETLGDAARSVLSAWHVASD